LFYSPKMSDDNHNKKQKISEEKLQDKFEEKSYKEWWVENRWKYVEGKVYDHTDNDWSS
jgi:hypothetical protein